MSPNTFPAPLTLLMSIKGKHMQGTLYYTIKAFR
jgi:hypothetical protein